VYGAYNLGYMADSNSANTGNKQNPLDILEQLLEDSKKSGGSAGSSSNGAAPIDQGPTPEELAAQEKAKQLAEFKVLKEEQDVVDQAALDAQRAKMAELKTTEQYQARVEQEEEKVKKQADVADQHKGYEILQLEHKKVAAE